MAALHTAGRFVMIKFSQQVIDVAVAIGGGRKLIGRVLGLVVVAGSGRGSPTHKVPHGARVRNGIVFLGVVGSAVATSSLQGSLGIASLLQGLGL